MVVASPMTRPEGGPKEPPTGKTSRYLGVSFFSRQRKYQAFVRHHGKTIHLGMWRREEEAAVARDRAVLHFRMKRVTLNLPRLCRKLGAASPETLLREARRRHWEDTGSSCYFGVTWSERRQRWSADVYAPHKRCLHIAHFVDETEAARAYDRVALHCLGDQARLNFPRTAKPAPLAEVQRAARLQYKTSRFRGVYKDERRGTWVAQLRLPSGRLLTLSDWGSEEEAATAYDRAASFYLAGGAVLNFPARKSVSADIATLAAEKRRRFKTTTTSKFRGVSWDSQRHKWRAAIGIGDRRILLGHFEDEDAAALAYDAKAKSAWGENAKPNFDPETGRVLYGERSIADLRMIRSRSR